MKFRCRIGRETLLTLLGVVTTLSKLTDSSASIVLNEDHFRFSVMSNQDANTNPRCYAELVNTAFVDYKIESQSANTIIFQLSLPLLSKALSSGKATQWSLFKLVKRDNRPCLSFESRAGGVNMDICHDIPIKLIHISDLQWLVPPYVAQPKVALALPTQRAVKSLVDKLGKFGRSLTLRAHQAGRIVLCMDEGGVKITSYLHNLRPHFLAFAEADQQGGHEGQEVGNEVSVKLVLKHLALLLDLHHLQYSQATLCKPSHRYFLTPALIYMMCFSLVW
jgi:hypothetical protein